MAWGLGNARSAWIRIASAVFGETRIGNAEKPRPARARSGPGAIGSALRAFAAGLILLAPGSAWALSDACNEINNGVAFYSNTGSPATYSGTYNTGSDPTGFGAEGTVNNYNLTFTPGERIQYSFNSNNGAYAQIALNDGSGYRRAGGERNTTAASGSGTMTIVAANDTLSISALSYPLDTDGVQSGPAEAGRLSKSFSVTISCLAPAPPTIGSLSPSSGPAAGGQIVTLNGTNLTGATLTVDGATRSTSNNTGSSLTFTTPAHVAGTVSVAVTTTGGTASSNYTYIAAPTVTGLSPSSGPTAGTNTVVLTGTNFLNATAVVFGGTPAPGYTVDNANQITVPAPAGSGTVNVRVVTAGGTSALGAANQYTYVAAPTVGTPSPASGPTGGGTTVTLTGTNLSGATLTVAGGNVTPTSTNATTVTFDTPAHAAGSVPVIVTTVGGTASTNFTYVATPTVSAVSPDSGPTIGGTGVTIIGSGFLAAPTTGAVKFGAADASYTIVNDTQISATSPSGSAGTIDVTVTTPGGTSATSAADFFTYIPAPTVAAVSPGSGPSAGGTAVIITGTNLSGATAVVFGGTGAAFLVDGPTQITATSPAGSGIVDIRVVTGGGTSATSVADQFTFVQAPTVGAPSPASGPTAGGTMVTLTGTNLSGATLTVDGNNVTPTSTTTTTVTFNTPAHVAGSVPVVVTTVGGSASTSYTYVAAPTIGTPSPASGPTAGGTQVTLTGTNLTGATLTVDGGAVTPTSNDGSTLVFDTPARGTGGTVTVEVTTAGGSASTSFTYVAPPVASPITASAVAYNASGVTFSIASAATNSPTGFAVGSATTANGGSVSVDSAGLVTYTAPTGFRGNDGFTFTATNLGGTSAPATVTVPIISPTLSSSFVGSGTRGVALSGVQINTTGGTAPYTCSTTLASGALPDGTQLEADCTVSGTPNASGSFNFTADVSDSTTGTGPVTQTTTQFTLNIAAPTISILPAGLQLPNGTVGTAYLQFITASGGSGTFTYAHTAGTLPPNVTVSGNSLTGTPTAAGTYDFTITATDTSSGPSGGPYSIVKPYRIVVDKGGQTITFGPISNLALSDTPPPLSASASSLLTVSFASTTSAVCTVTGTTVDLHATGTCTITASQLGDADWNAAPDVQQSFTVTPDALTITPGAPSGLQVGAAYSHTNQAAGGVLPYSYSLGAGAFVPGTTIDTSTGTVSGTPTVAGSFSYIVRVTDAQPGVFADTSVTTVNIAKGNQTVSFTSTAPAATVGGTPYNVTASASSGLGVTFMLDPSSAGCDLAGNTITFVATGTCVVNALQAGDSNWNPATSAQQSFAIGAAGAITTSVSFAPTSLGVGDTGTVTITFTNPNTMNSPDIAPLFSSSALLARTGLGGSCGATGSDAGANFQFNAFSIPFGSCTVTLDYTGTIAGASGGQVLGAFTPSGYPTTPAAAGNAFSVVPTVTGVSPSSGPVSQVVTIDGTGFSTTPGNNTVNFGASPGTVTAASATSLTVTAPAIGSGPVNVTVTVNGQTSTTSGSFTFIDKPIAADKPGVGVAYDSPGTVIDLAASITGGPHSSIAIGTAAAHGTTSIAGDQVTYTPTTGYFGTDSFTYTATGAGGTSNVATVSITVATPAAPTVSDKNGVAIPYNGTGTTIDLSGSISGVHASIAVSTAPAHGTFSIAGDVVTYTPAANYYGTDSFEFTATGPGGTSALATVHLTVDNPPAPVAAAKPGVAVPYASAGTAIDLSGSITGVHTGIAVTTAPTHGTFTIAGDVVTYTPAATHYGADSFEFTATGPGGTSAPALVSITVANPPAPTVANKSGVSVAYNSSGTTIDLSGSITGVHASIAVTTAPTHGTFSIAGDVVTYTPTAGYHGPDSFEFTATGPGGTSAPATVDLTVVTPAAPVAAAKPGVAVAYNSPGTAIDLSGSITGVHASIAVSTAPTHGTTSIAGDVVTYTPTAGYHGADSFEFTATGPGGTSAPALVSITVATPPAPTVAAKPGVGVPYASAGTAIDLSGSITGVHTSIAVSTAPTHGTVSIAGDVVTYTPAATYYGADSFEFTATGPGGTSAPAVVSITVANPPAPVVADKPGVAVAYGSTGTAIDLSGSITGVHSAIAIGTAPAHGTVTIAGDVVTYTPAATYYGADSFTFTATGPGGTSAPATVSLTVATPATPVAADKPGVAVPYASAGTAIDLSASITGVHASIAVGTAPAHGTVTIAGDVVTYTPAATYFGADSFTYTATGPGGTSAPATVGLTVATPPAPVAAARSGVAVPYASTGTAIDLSGSITGVHSSIAVATAPAHGTVTIAGDVVTYTPAATYYGPDSFAYTATGPGGTSAQAVVSLTVATPPAPTVADKPGVAVPYASTGTAIDLSASVAGVHSAIAVATAPTHGTVTIAGDVVTYTPAATYYGADSFTFTATGPGGTSAPATVNLTVATPPAPVAAGMSGTLVPYESTGTSFDLSGSITGVHSSIAIGTQPAHGTVTVGGDIVFYKPAATYYGPDSFTYTATGPGGTSAPATVTFTVATPAAPTGANKSANIAYNSAGTAIDLAPSITGVHSALTIATAPTHGTATVNGDVVTYTPTAGYFGADSFTYTVTGPGGTSAAATVSLTVETPPPPVAAPGTGSVAGSTTTAGTSVDINLSALVTGVYDTIQIATPPAHGTVTLSGGGTAMAPGGVSMALLAPAPYIATYTPAANYAGTDSFTFTATGPGGTSAPGTVTITVVGQTPVAAPKVATTGDGQTVSVMLTDGAIRGPFTGANVVSVSPANAATTAIVATGNGGYRLDATPSNRYGGTIVVTYTLSNVFGASAPSTVTLTVQARPDPRNDPNVGAISDAQAEAARRFARAQVSNFLRRTEQLHNGGGQAGISMGMTLASRDVARMERPDDKNWGLAITDRMRRSSEDPAIGRFANNPQTSLSRADQLGYGRNLVPGDRRDPAAGPPKAAADMDEDGIRRIGSVATWAGGAIDIGTRDKTTDRTKVTATTAGLSAGADVKLGEGIVVGLGGGYGNDLSRIGTAAQVRGTSTLYAAYASLQPVEGAFIDGVVGRGQLDFTTRRIAAAVNATARGSRDGSYTIAAVSLGIDRSGGGLNWSIYGRGEYMDADLDAYAETGAGRYDLRFDAREVRSVTGTLGGRIEYRQKVSFGSITPRVRAEWNHEFADVDAQFLDYADIPGAAIYALSGNGWKREQLQLSLGTRFDILNGGWSFDFETGLRAGQGEKAGTLQLRLSKQF